MTLGWQYLTLHDHCGTLLDTLRLSSYQRGNQMPGSDQYGMLVEATMPSGYLDDVVDLVVGAYADAYQRCGDRYSPKVAAELRPHERRAIIEDGWLTLANRYPGQVVAESSPNRLGSAHHTVVQCGPVLLTASKVDSPDDVPRSALFRNTYAQRPQRVLDLPGIAPPDGYEITYEADGLYGLLIHSPSDDNPAAPSFVMLGFPDRHCTTYVARIDLLARRRMAQVAAPVDVQPVEPTLRRSIRAVGEARG